MISVAEAEQIVLSHVRDLGTEEVHFQEALGRVLAENILADRDMPAFNRVTMDGVAISYEAFAAGERSFKIAGTQAAGEDPIELSDKNECIEIMTGAATPDSADTVIRYEDLEITDGAARILIDNVKKGQNIHKKGIDKKEGDIVAETNTIITAATISVAAFTGKRMLKVKRRPKIVALTNGDELQDVGDTPPPYKIRRSNSYTIQAALQEQGLDADLLHLPDNEDTIEKEIGRCLEEYDAIIVSGGVSMGKFDLVAKTLEQLNVRKQFHKVQQRPGKPFWFGTHESGATVFAFPGNPVSTFMCFHRYFLPWYKKCMGISSQKLFAVLDDDISFAPRLQYFLQVSLQMNGSGQVIAKPAEGNGSGDLANLVEADAFMELPAELDNFKKGEVYRIWPFKRII
jgi:molybdopterin molybdotransferase